MDVLDYHLTRELADQYEQTHTAYQLFGSMIDKRPLPLEFVDRLVVRPLLLKKRTSKQLVASALLLYVEH